jgi:hypothetical protein
MQELEPQTLLLGHAMVQMQASSRCAVGQQWQLKPAGQVMSSLLHAPPIPP